MSTAGNIIDGLKRKKVSGYGFVHESKLEKRFEDIIDEEEIDEDEWKTMRKKASKEEIEAGVRDANTKSKESKSNKSKLSSEDEDMVRKSFASSDSRDRKLVLNSLLVGNNKEVFGSVKDENPEMYKELMQADTQTIIDNLARKVSNGDSKINDSMPDDKKKKLKKAIDSHIKNLDKVKNLEMKTDNEDDYVKTISDLTALHKDVAKSQLEIAKLIW